MTNAMRIASKGKAGFTTATEIASQGRLVGAGAQIIYAIVVRLTSSIQTVLELTSRIGKP